VASYFTEVVKEKKMTGKLFWLGILAITLVFGMTVIGCDNGNDSPSHTHEWGDWVVTTFATCTADGVETKTCALDASHKETRPIPALGHDWGDWVVTKAPTATEAGEETRTCKRDPTHTETQVVEKVSFIGTWNGYSGEPLQMGVKLIFVENNFTIISSQYGNISKGTFTVTATDIQLSFTHEWQNNQWVVYTGSGIMPYNLQDNNTLVIVSYNGDKTNGIVGTYKRQQ
jgi:hypothetical protein